jgi:DNA-binding NtrC family response regulator
MKILLIEDENITRITLDNTLQKEGYDITSTESGRDGLNKFFENIFDVVITDLRLPHLSGMEILKVIKEKNPDCYVIIITAFATIDTAIEAMKLGAYDYLTKPFPPDRLISMLKHIQQLRDALEENATLRKKLKSIEEKVIVGISPQIKQLVETIKTVAAHDYTVLIEGESGTGKELVARALHSYSPRKDCPFVPMNCAAIPESLLESELFGHEKGSFTGAIKRHIGYFERANSIAGKITKGITGKRIC